MPAIFFLSKGEGARVPLESLFEKGLENAPNRKTCAVAVAEVEVANTDLIG